ncbi:MAG: precorrin-3B C(17)-methyltransferase [Clostridia bacterium]|nr:precorrin-3B C(17)-methyltransferase [Clostridia bacterium]
MSKLYVVGIGPGSRGDMTKRADSALRAADVIIGYGVYTELIRDHYPEKEFISTPMTEEVKRCRIAIELASAGKTVAVVCSGDSGVYGMAALIYELRGESLAPQIRVIPGVTAALSGGALLGAPISHDFAVISLSDRLTPWEKIERRLSAAAWADMAIVIYNPGGRARPDHLKRACETLLKILPKDRVCGIARNVGRDNESRKILSLLQLRDETVDMFSTVFIGNSETKIINENMITPRGYKNV